MGCFHAVSQSDHQGDDPAAVRGSPPRQRRMYHLSGVRSGTDVPGIFLLLNHKPCRSILMLCSIDPK